MPDDSRPGGAKPADPVPADIARWRRLVDGEIGRRPEGFWAAQRGSILGRLAAARERGAARRWRPGFGRPAGRRVTWAGVGGAAVVAGLAAAVALWVIPPQVPSRPAAGDQALLADVARLAAGSPPAPLEPLAAGLGLDDLPAGGGASPGRDLPAGLDDLAPAGLLPAPPVGPAEEWFGGDDDEAA